MLDTFYLSDSKAQIYYQDENFNIWKFPAQVETGKRQKRPIILNYSIMTRAYGTFFNKDSFIDYFNKHGFDVYLMDWGKEHLFTLSGWTLDMLADALKDKALEPLLKEYNVDNVNIFGICIGGLLISHLINREQKKDKDFAKKFHKVAYYGSPILGARDLGMLRAFLQFYDAMKPYRPILDNTGISLTILNMLITQGTSNAMLEFAWQRFWEDGPESCSKLVSLTIDDRWVPFAAFMDILEKAFRSKAKKEIQPFHFEGDVSNIHFFNLVGERDPLVMPSASIVEHGSQIPWEFASFEQVIFQGGHFAFARPGFNEVKERLAVWFAEDPRKLQWE
jgi:hypothetical protein